MESVKRRKLKFPCFSGDNEECPRCRTVQSWPPCIATTEQNLFKFEVAKGTSKQLNVKSARKCSPSILAMLMGRGGYSSFRSIHKKQKRLSDSSSKNGACQKNDNLFHHKVVHEDSEASHVANQHQPSQSEGPCYNYKKLTTEVGFHRCKCIDDKGTAKSTDTRTKDGFESGRANLVEYGNLGDESLHVSTSISVSESVVITTPSRITIHQNDRLTHSQSNMSEPSLIREAKNRMLERWKMTNCVQGDVGMVSKGRTLSDMFSSTDKETRPAESESVVGLVGVINVFDSLLGSRSTSLISPIHDPNHRMNIYHDDDADEKVVVYSEPLNQDRRKDMPYEKVRYNKMHHSSHCSNITATEFGNYLPESHSYQKLIETSFENESPPKHESLISCTDNGAICAASSSDAVTGYDIEVSLEISNRLNQSLASRMLGDAASSWADGNTSKVSQLSGPELECSKRVKNVDHNNQFPVLEVPPSDEDVSSDSECFGRLNSRLQDLKKQLHLLKVESTLTPNNLTPIRKNKPLDQLSSVAISDSKNRESSFMAQILQASEMYDITPDNSPPWEIIHHPIDPRVYYHLEKYYFQGDVLRVEKHLLYDYFEQTYIRTSKSMVAYPWVGPEKRESQLTLTKLNLEDQIRKVVNGIEKEGGESFFAMNYDKDPEWLKATNEVDILGKLLAEFVLNDLLLEVVHS